MAEEEDVEVSALRDLIRNLTESMKNNLGMIHEGLSNIRQEMRHEIETTKDRNFKA